MVLHGQSWQTGVGQGVVLLHLPVTVHWTQLLKHTSGHGPLIMNTAPKTGKWSQYIEQRSWTDKWSQYTKHGSWNRQEAMVQWTPLLKQTRGHGTVNTAPETDKRSWYTEHSSWNRQEVMVHWTQLLKEIWHHRHGTLNTAPETANDHGTLNTAETDKWSWYSEHSSWNRQVVMVNWTQLLKETWLQYTEHTPETDKWSRYTEHGSWNN